MPGSAVEPRPGKRERLLAAAMELLHRQGVENTTLADIAQRADVPVGNIYYYFKTKDEIVDAVVEAHVRGIEDTLVSFDRRYHTPKGRLKALIRLLATQNKLVAEYGCPHGTLSSELEKQTGGSDHSARRLVEVPIDWAEKQFLSMGQPDARDLAVRFIAAYHGAAVLTQALREPELLSRESRRLQHWIDSIGSEPPKADR
jgi:AcrR family transcriptional regulator